MSSNETTSGAAKKGTPVFLLLFVGFIFGLAFGYGSKDTIHRTFVRMTRPPVQASGDIPSGFEDGPGVTSMEMDEGALTEESDEKKKEDEADQEKKDGAEKKAE